MKKTIFLLIIISLLLSFSYASFGDNSTSDAKSPITIHETANTKEIVVQTLEYIKFTQIMDDAFLVYEDGTGETWIINSQGDQLAHLQLSEIPNGFLEGRTAVKLYGKDDYVLIDSFGTLYPIEKPKGTSKVKEVSRFVDGVAMIKFYSSSDYENRWCYIDPFGKILNFSLSTRDYSRNVIEPYPLCDGRRLHQDAKSSLYGFLNEKMEVVIPLQFRDASSFSEGLAAVSIARGHDELWGFIDTDGNWVIPPKFSVRPGSFHDGFAAVTKKNGTRVYINTSGEVCSEEFLSAYDFINGKALVKKVGERDKYYIVDKDLNIIVDKNNGLFNPDYCTYCKQTNTIYKEGSIYWDSGEVLFKANKNNRVAPFYTDVAIFYTTKESRYYSSESYQPIGIINMNGEVILKFVESEF